jgi:hypothetical protein
VPARGLDYKPRPLRRLRLQCLLPNGYLPNGKTLASWQNAAGLQATVRD